jgi:hypothetical protein
MTIRPRRGNDPLLLALAEEGELLPRDVEVTDADAGELGAPDAAIEQHEEGESIA